MIENNEYVLLGEGSYAKAYKINDNNILKLFKTKRSKKLRSKKQSVLNKIDPKRIIFGGRILKYIVKGKDDLKGVITELECLTLERILTRIHTFKLNDKLFLLTKFLNLLEGVIRLVEAGYVHGDIKSDNLMYNTKQNVLKYIDYDFMSIYPYKLSERVTKTESFFIYWVWPPELWFNIICNLKIFLNTDEGKCYQKEYKKDLYLLCETLHKIGIFNTHRDDHLLENFMLTGKMEHTDNVWLDDLYSTFSENKLKSSVFVLRKHNFDYTKIDIYGLGLIAAEIFYKDPLFIKMRPLIYQMIHPNAEYRLSPKVAYENWSHFCNYYTYKYLSSF